MSGLRDRLNRLSGKTRYVVCRLFIHLSGKDAIPLLGVLNQAARDAVAAEGEMEALGESLVSVSQGLLQMSLHWQSAANEGDVFWDEAEAGDYVEQLFTDSAQRYLSEPNLSQTLSEEEALHLPVSNNLVVMITAAYEGETPDLETNLADVESLEYGLKALVNLHYQGLLRAVQIHFSPAQLGDELDDDQLLTNFPELIPL